MNIHTEFIDLPQVTAYISSLTPDQVKEKQDAVVKAVAQQATEQGLASEEATQLLHQTLEYNGLPQAGLHNPSSSAEHQTVPGLPVPGTLEHTVALGLFNAQQYINGMLSGSSASNAADTKLGGEQVSGGAGGILDTVAALPQSVSNAAVEVLKFVTPGASGTVQAASGSSPLPGQTYSEVVTGVDPTYAALGVLTTGALASVAYSYVASDQDIASSATSLALGAVDAIARNDLVENIKNNNIVEKISNNDIVQKISNSEIMQKISNSDIVQRAKHAMQNSKFIQKASSAIEKIKRKIKGDQGPSEYEYNNSQDYYNIDYTYADPQSYPDTPGSYPDGFSPSWDEFQTNFDYLQEVDYSDRYPYQETQQVIQEAPQEVEEGRIEFYDPPPSPPSEKVSFISYTEDHNPWHLMTSGQSTDHLYRAFSN